MDAIKHITFPCKDRQNEKEPSVPCSVRPWVLRKLPESPSRRKRWGASGVDGGRRPCCQSWDSSTKMTNSFCARDCPTSQLFDQNIHYKDNWKIQLSWKNFWHFCSNSINKKCGSKERVSKIQKETAECLKLVLQLLIGLQIDLHHCRSSKWMLTDPLSYNASVFRNTFHKWDLRCTKRCLLCADPICHTQCNGSSLCYPW